VTNDTADVVRRAEVQLLVRKKTNPSLLERIPMDGIVKVPKEDRGTKDRKIKACIPRYVLCGLRQAG
jgi:hypothetical protein